MPAVTTVSETGVSVKLMLIGFSSLTTVFCSLSFVRVRHSEKDWDSTDELSDSFKNEVTDGTSSKKSVRIG